MILVRELLLLENICLNRDGQKPNVQQIFKQSLEVGLYQSITNGAVWSFFSVYP